MRPCSSGRIHILVHTVLLTWNNIFFLSCNNMMSRIFVALLMGWREQRTVRELLWKPYWFSKTAWPGWWARSSISSTLISSSPRWLSDRQLWRSNYHFSQALCKWLLITVSHCVLIFKPASVARRARLSSSARVPFLSEVPALTRRLYRHVYCLHPIPEKGMPLELFLRGHLTRGDALEQWYKVMDIHLGNDAVQAANCAFTPLWAVLHDLTRAVQLGFIFKARRAVGTKREESVPSMKILLTFRNLDTTDRFFSIYFI